MATTRTPARARKQQSPLTFADLVSRIRRPQRITELILDAEAAAQVDALTALLDRARARDEALGGEPIAPEVARQLQEAEVRADASRVQITMEAIPHTEYKNLLAKHPPTAEQLAEFGRAGSDVERWPFDPDAFAPVLVRAQMIDPEPPPVEEFAAFWNALSDGQLRNLWLTAIGVQMQVTTLAPRSETAADLLRTAGA
jgi:hypothetical protein